MSEFLVEHRKSIWGVFLLCLIFSIAGIPKLGVTPDNRVFYGADDERYLQLLEFEDHFGTSTNMVWVLHCDQPIQDCPELAQAVRDITDQAHLLDDVVEVDSLATYPLIQSTSTSVSTASFLDVICPNNCDLGPIDDSPVDHLIGRFTNHDFSTLAVVAKLDLDIHDPTAVQRLYAQGSALKAFAPKNIDVYFVGTVPLMHAFISATYNELSGVMSVAIIAILLALFLTLGSVILTALLAGLGIATIAVTLGLAGWSGLILNTATATIPLVLFTLVIAASMHFFMSISRSITDDRRTTVNQALSAALSTQTRPILLTASTTIVCMLSLLTVSSPPVQDIGVWTAIGVFVGTTLLLSVVPLVIANVSSLPKSRWHQKIQPILNLQARRVERIGTTSIVVASITILTLASILHLEIDDDFIRFFDSDEPFRVDSEWVSENVFGPNSIEVIVDSGAEEGVFDPSYIYALTELTNRIESHGHVSNVYSLLDILEPISTHLGSGQPLNRLSRDELSQLFLAYELSLEYGNSTTNFVSLDRSKSRISVIVEDISSQKIIDLEDYIIGLQHRFESISLMVTGESIPISHLSPNNIFSMTASILMTFIMTSLALAVYFRRWRIAVIAIVSTVVPVICGFGIWGLFYDSIGLASTVIVAVCMGVVIDDTIHMIYSHADANRRLKLNGRQASAYAVHRVGSAMLTTTIILGLGFGILLLSDFRLNSSFGGCSTLILVCALLFDLRILPEMLVWATNGER